MNAIFIPLFKKYAFKIIVIILTVITYSTFISCNSDESLPQTNNLLGEWKLIAFVDTANDITTTENDFENSNEITIHFKEDSQYTGNTVLNDFFGSYTVNNANTVLVFEEMSGTEVNETDWGTLFFEKLNLNYNSSTENWNNDIELLDNGLKLYYSENKYMKFDKS